MEAGNISAIISAVSAISGVVLGNFLVAFKEGRARRLKERQDTAYLGIIVVSHLERYIAGCFDVSQDDGTSCGQPAGEDGQHQATVELPEFHPLDLDVEWKLLPKGLMYSVLRLPDQQDQLQGTLRGIQEYNFDPPDHPQYFLTRRRGYAGLGLQASDIAKNLRKHAGLPADEHHLGEWNRDKSMRDLIVALDSLEEKRRSRDASSAEIIDF